MKKSSWCLLIYFILLVLYRQWKNPKDLLYKHGFRR